MRTVYIVNYRICRDIYQQVANLVNTRTLTDYDMVNSIIAILHNHGINLTQETNISLHELLDAYKYLINRRTKYKVSKTPNVRVAFPKYIAQIRVCHEIYYRALKSNYKSDFDIMNDILTILDNHNCHPGDPYIPLSSKVSLRALLEAYKEVFNERYHLKTLVEPSYSHFYKHYYDQKA